LSGALANARYDLLAKAQDATDKDQPSSLAWLHGVDPAATVSVSNWLAPPTGLSATGGVYAFTRAAGAAFHTIELDALSCARLWSISVFDDSSSFSLPGLSPDPIATGMASMQVSALQIPGIDVQNVSFDDAREKITGLSSDQITFTH